jgi:hypothetical protein
MIDQKVEYDLSTNYRFTDRGHAATRIERICADYWALADERTLQYFMTVEQIAKEQGVSPATVVDIVRSNAEMWVSIPCKNRGCIGSGSLPIINRIDLPSALQTLSSHKCRSGFDDFLVLTEDDKAFLRDVGISGKNLTCIED